MTEHAEIGAITGRSVTPGTLRILAESWEPMRGTVIASGDIEDGTDTSVGAGILIDGMKECADAWEAVANRLAVYSDFAHVVRNGYDVANAVAALNAALAKIT